MLILALAHFRNYTTIDHIKFTFHRTATKLNILSKVAGVTFKDSFNLLFPVMTMV